MSETEKTVIISMAPELALLTTGLRAQLEREGGRESQKERERVEWATPKRS